MREGENPMVEKVSGYRVLNDVELAFINKCKAQGDVLQALLEEANEIVRARTEQFATPDSEHYRAIALGKTNIQQGYMWLIRAVAAPNGLV
jgi:hypothetical protein